MNLNDESPFYVGDVMSWIVLNLKNRQQCDGGLDWNISFAVALWHIWGERNNFVFRGRKKVGDQSFWSIYSFGEEISNHNAKLGGLKVCKRRTLT